MIFYTALWWELENISPGALPTFTLKMYFQRKNPTCTWGGNKERLDDQLDKILGKTTSNSIFCSANQTKTNKLNKGCVYNMGIQSSYRH